MKTFKQSLITIAFFLPFLVFSGEFPSTKDVWQHHIQSWENRNLDEIASDYDQDSIMIINNITYKGQKKIKEVFRSLFKIFDNGSNIISPTIIIDETIYITWYFTPLNDRQFFGTDTFIISDGKIKVQTIASLLYFHYRI